MILRPYLPGDANQDGKVDINDLTIVLAHYNQTGMTWLQGEFTGSGKVDINDLTIVLAHYNGSLSSSAGGFTAVPEPSAVILLTALCRWPSGSSAGGVADGDLERGQGLKRAEENLNGTDDCGLVRRGCHVHRGWRRAGRGACSLRR